MKVKQQVLRNGDDFNMFAINPNLILVFGTRSVLNETNVVTKLRSSYQGAIITGCSTAGEIFGSQVADNSITLTAVEFEKTQMKYSEVTQVTNENSHEKGRELALKFETNQLRHILVFSDGLTVNGSELVSGLKQNLPNGVSITGGLAGDGSNFEKTVVINNDGDLVNGMISAIGFYGDNVKIGYGSFGGWDSFGIERIVSKSKGNIVYEIDSQPALDLYKSFLGDKANELPSSALLFPLSMRHHESGEPLVRTILSIDDAAKSMTFAGDVPEGAYVKLMKGNIDRLIKGAENAAKLSIETAGENISPSLSLLISCVGRKLLMKQLVEEEVEAVKDIMGKEAILTGFYSYGEIAPFASGLTCELHNQTMTITTFNEN